MSSYETTLPSTNGGGGGGGSQPHTALRMRDLRVAGEPPSIPVTIQFALHPHETLASGYLREAIADGGTPQYVG